MKVLREATAVLRCDADSRAMAASALSGASNAVLGAAKVLLGVFAFSPFACVNGLYTLALVASRACLLGAARASKSTARWCLWASWLMFASSVLYMAYSGWAFFHPSIISVHRYVALGIATVAFAEIGMNIYGVVKTRHAHNLPMHVLRAVNLAASLVTMVLTQSVLVQISDADNYDPAWNGACGVFMGSIAAVIAIAEIVRCSRRCKQGL